MSKDIYPLNYRKQQYYNLKIVCTPFRKYIECDSCYTPITDFNFIQHPDSLGGHNVCKDCVAEWNREMCPENPLWCKMCSTKISRVELGVMLSGYAHKESSVGKDVVTMLPCDYQPGAKVMYREKVSPWDARRREGQEDDKKNRNPRSTLAKGGGTAQPRNPGEAVWAAPHWSETDIRKAQYHREVGDLREQFEKMKQMADFIPGVGHQEDERHELVYLSPKTLKTFWAKKVANFPVKVKKNFETWKRLYQK